MTGAPIPTGADAVVPVEHTQRLDAGRVLIQKAVAPGKSIAPRGSDAAANSIVLRSGHRLGPAHPELGLANHFRKRIDELYKLTQNDEAYAPEQFVASLQQLQAELDKGVKQ